MRTLKGKLFVLLMMISSVTFAQEFGDFDINGDGMWDQNEFNVGFENSFGEWDANQDGFLDDNEFADTSFNLADRDRNEMIDEEEWGVGADFGDNDFGTFDADRNNSLTDDEWNEGIRNSGWFDDNDMNKDRRLDQTEFNEGMFNTWDEDGNGFLDANEFERNRLFD